MTDRNPVFKAYGVHLQHTALSQEVLLFVTAGIICFSTEPKTQKMYLLLGQEHCFYDFRTDKGDWCNFSGKVDDGEDEVRAAAREFAEESMCVIRLFHGKAPLCTPEYVDEVHRMLVDGDYFLKVSVILPPEDLHERIRLYYLKEVPWQPDVPERFQQTREVFLKRRDDFLNTEVPLDMCHHPGLTATGIDTHFTEKIELKWWSLDRLRDVLHNRGWYKHHRFRHAFLPVLRIVIDRLGASKKVV